MSKVTELKDKFVEIYTENIKAAQLSAFRKQRLLCCTCFYKIPRSIRGWLVRTQHTRL